MASGSLSSSDAIGICDTTEQQQQKRRYLRRGAMVAALASDSIGSIPSGCGLLGVSISYSAFF